MHSSDDKIALRPRLCNACCGRRFTLMGQRSDGVDVLRCEACGLGVIDVVPSDLASLYDDAYYGVGGDEQAVGYSDYRFTAEHGLSWAAAIIRLIKPGGRVLDIGCADGALLTKIPDSFERYGIEVNPLMAARAAEAGITIIGSDLLAPSIARDHCGSFDMITAIAVFEHLPDLRRGMQVALDLLKPDGVLLFEVPYISATHENRIWFESSLEHVYYPSGEALRLLVENLGGRLVGGEVYIQDFASNFVGLAARDAALIPGLHQLFDALNSNRDVAVPPEQRLARIQLLLIHAARSTPELISGLPELLTGAANPPLVQRIEQLWQNDLRRLSALCQESAAAQTALAKDWSERYWTLQERAAARDAQLARTRAERDALRVELAARDARLATARSEHDALQRQLGEVLDSTAWKLTYPLRRFGARHRPAARAIAQALKFTWWSARLELPSRLRAARQRRRERDAQLGRELATDPPGATR